jgi:arsenate reductase
MKIYHNPRCRKSREGLAILEEARVEHEIIDYLNNPPSEEEIRELLSKLNMDAIELVRQNEAVWKEKFKGKDLSSEEIIRAMADHPKLIERPIVVRGSQAVVGRPPEKIKSLL